jgi:DNA modification methylase
MKKPWMQYYTGDSACVLPDVVANHTLALILTDLAYKMPDANALYEWLHWFAAAKLKPGGSLIYFSGHKRLPLDFACAEAAGLKYWWHLVALNHQSPRIRGTFVVAQHKPVLWFVRGSRRRVDFQPYVLDVLRPSKRDKSKHPWGQGDGGIAPLIEKLTKPGELVCDPFCGTGEWGRIIAGMGRRWIGCDLVKGGSTEIEVAGALAALNNNRKV